MAQKKRPGAEDTFLWSWFSPSAPLCGFWTQVFSFARQVPLATEPSQCALCCGLYSASQWLRPCVPARLIIQRQFLPCFPRPSFSPLALGCLSGPGPWQPPLQLIGRVFLTPSLGSRLLRVRGRCGCCTLWCAQYVLMPPPLLQGPASSPSSTFILLFLFTFYVIGMRVPQVPRL